MTTKQPQWVAWLLQAPPGFEGEVPLVLENVKVKLWHRDDGEEDPARDATITFHKPKTRKKK